MKPAPAPAPAPAPTPAPRESAPEFEPGDRVCWESCGLEGHGAVLTWDAFSTVDNGEGGLFTLAELVALQGETEEDWVPVYEFFDEPGKGRPTLVQPSLVRLAEQTE